MFGFAFIHFRPLTTSRIRSAPPVSFSAPQPIATASIAFTTSSWCSSIHFSAFVMSSTTFLNPATTVSGSSFVRSPIRLLIVSPICFSIAWPSGVFRYLFSSLNRPVIVSMPSVRGPENVSRSCILNVSHSSCILLYWSSILPRLSTCSSDTTFQEFIISS